MSDSNLTPREIVQKLRDPMGGGLYEYGDPQDLLEERAGVIFQALIDTAEQAGTRHLKRAELCYQLIKGEPVGRSDIEFYNLDQYAHREGIYLISSVYDAFSHLTGTLLELRYREENAVTGVLELMIGARKRRDCLNTILQRIDNQAGKIFQFIETIQTDNSTRLPDYMNRYVRNGFAFQSPVEDVALNPHWGSEANFYAHHQGQWKEVCIAIPQIQKNANLEKYNNIQKLFRVFENAFGKP